MTHKEINNIVENYLSGKATKEELEIIEQFEDFNSKLLGKEFVLSDLEKGKMKNAIMAYVASSKKKRPRFSPHFLPRVAAVLIVGICISYWGFDFLKNHSDTIVVNERSDKPKTFLLEDGSTVILDTNSKLLYSKQGFNQQTRKVELEGNAFFRVVKDKDRPFMVKSGDVMTKVLGTSFHVKTEGKTLEVVVSTGAVTVSSKQNSVRLAPNQKGVYHPNSKTLVKKDVNADLYSLWFKEYVILKKVSIDELAHFIKMTYNKNVAYINREAKNFHLYSFRIKRNEPLEKLIERINAVNEVQLEFNNNSIEINTNKIRKDPPQQTRK